MHTQALPHSSKATSAPSAYYLYTLSIHYLSHIYTHYLYYYTTQIEEAYISSVKAGKCKTKMVSEIFLLNYDKKSSSCTLSFPSIPVLKFPRFSKGLAGQTAITRQDLFLRSLHLQGDSEQLSPSSTRPGRHLSAV